jgi:putative phosphonate catabolism associated alcohol dehydrogenase
MPETMAAVYHGVPGSMTLESVTLPEPQPNEVLVRILGCTLCGSDLHTFTGRRVVATPTVLGHEMVGEIVAFGDCDLHQDYAGQPLTIGDRVTWAIVAACRGCFYCTHDLWPKCERGTKYGHEKWHGPRDILGGLAGHALLVAGTAMMRLPTTLPLEVACPANCATATLAAALEAAGDVRDKTIVILGMGLLGLTAAAMAQHGGAKCIVAVDVNSGRLELARKFGATHTALPRDLADLLPLLTSNRGADVLLELSGSTSALANTWPHLRIGGTIVLVGAVFPGAEWVVSPEKLIRKQITIRGVHNYSPRHLVSAVRFLEAAHDRYPFAEVVSKWYPLSEVEAAFQDAELHQPIRIGVTPD